VPFDPETHHRVSRFRGALKRSRGRGAFAVIAKCRHSSHVPGVTQ
jgi:hypothetical protein